jgi:diamine N-acetyltransferase
MRDSRVRRWLSAWTRRRPVQRRRGVRGVPPVQIREIRPSDRDDLLSLYRTFDPAQRSQGLPPVVEERRVAWVDGLVRDSLGVAARSDGRIVGHAVLVPDGQRSYELALFVHQDYQGAGIGGALVDAIVTLAGNRGGGRIWLSVERRNHRAIALYRRMGFREVSADQNEQVWTLPVEKAGAA